MKSIYGFLTMKWFFNLKTTWKLVIIISVVSLAGIGSGMYSYVVMNTMNQQTGKVFFNNIQGISEVYMMRLDMAEVRYNYWLVINYGDFKGIGQIKDRVPRIGSQVKSMQKFPVESVAFLAEDWVPFEERFNELVKDPQTFVEKNPRAFLTAYATLESDLNIIEQDLQKLAVHTKKEMAATASSSAKTIGVWVILFLLIAGAMGYVTIRSISVPLRHLRHAMLGLASGDLQMPKLPPATMDEIGETSKAYEESVQQLRHMLSNVSEVTSSLTTIVSELSPQIAATGAAADAVSQTMNELARGTQEQARAADEVASTIHSVVEQIDRAGTKTKVIAEYSTTVIAEARQGEEDTQTILRHINDLSNASNRATSVIQKLQERSLQIESIVGKIREITEQTQLLALNASIEAARAGEYGRGFGVVALEVGKLAEKSAQAVHDVEAVLGNIQSMVSNAVEVMEEGVEQANEGRKVITETSERFNQIFASINKVAAEIQAVALETAGLSTANKRVLEEIDTIAAISEQTAANTEEVMATVENQASSVTLVAQGMKRLKECSKELDESVDRFHLS